MNDAITVRDAITTASHWLNTTEIPIRSAFVGGSVAYADPEATYDPASDVDCYLVIDGEPPPGKIGKITVDGVLLDVSWIPWNQLEQAESHAVLSSLLHFGRIVRDDDGALTELQRVISGQFGDEQHIAARLDDMRSRIRVIGNQPIQHAEPEMVMNWLFPATVATHIPLIAAGAPLTVRKRFVAAKRVMQPDEYEELLALYGFDTVTPELAQGWLHDTADLFDHAAPIAKHASRFWASDIYAEARPIAIGGSQQLIDTGLHREAMYWIIATRTRCLTVMNDAGADTSAFIPAFEEMTTALGIESVAKRATRSEAILAWIDQYNHTT